MKPEFFALASRLESISAGISSNSVCYFFSSGEETRWQRASSSSMTIYILLKSFGMGLVGDNRRSPLLDIISLAGG
jgi:hypothetical protein